MAETQRMQGRIWLYNSRDPAAALSSLPPRRRHQQDGLPSPTALRRHRPPSWYDRLTREGGSEKGASSARAQSQHGTMADRGGGHAASTGGGEADSLPSPGSG